MFFLYSKINSIVKDAMEGFDGLTKGFTTDDVMEVFNLASESKLADMDEETFFKVYKFYEEAAPSYYKATRLYEEEKRKDYLNQIDEIQVEPLNDKSITFLNLFPSIEQSIKKLESMGKGIELYRKIQERKNQQFIESVGGVDKLAESIFQIWQKVHSKT